MTTDIKTAPVVANRPGQPSHDGILFKDTARDSCFTPLVSSREACGTRSDYCNLSSLYSFHSCDTQPLAGQRILQR